MQSVAEPDSDPQLQVNCDKANFMTLFFRCNAFAFNENASRCDYYRVEAEKYKSVTSTSN
jgi:hypothetical protein